MCWTLEAPVSSGPKPRLKHFPHISFRLFYLFQVLTARCCSSRAGWCLWSIVGLDVPPDNELVVGRLRCCGFLVEGAATSPPPVVWFTQFIPVNTVNEPPADGSISSTCCSVCSSQSYSRILTISFGVFSKQMFKEV